jgi:hypothetical protein
MHPAILSLDHWLVPNKENVWKLQAGEHRKPERTDQSCHRSTQVSGVCRRNVRRRNGRDRVDLCTLDYAVDDCVFLPDEGLPYVTERQGFASVQ